MQLQLVGVVEDGARRSPELPDNTRLQIAMGRGTNLELVIYVVRADNSPVDLQADLTAQIFLNVRKNSLDQFSPIRKVLGPPIGRSKYGNNVAVINIVPADTVTPRWIQPGRYVYDVLLAYNGQRNLIIPLSPFILQPGMERP